MVSVNSVWPNPKPNPEFPCDLTCHWHLHGLMPSLNTLCICPRMFPPRFPSFPASFSGSISSLSLHVLASHAQCLSSMSASSALTYSVISSVSCYHKHHMCTDSCQNHMSIPGLPFWGKNSSLLWPVVGWSLYLKSKRHLKLHTLMSTFWFSSPKLLLLQLPY